MNNVLEFMTKYLMNERLDKIVAKNSDFRTEEAKANIALQNACSATYANLSYGQGMGDIVNLVLGLVTE